MKKGNLWLALAGIILLGTGFCEGQSTAENKPEAVVPVVGQSVRFSPAYAEILLKGTELLAELESLVIDYTDDYPKVQELKHTLGLIQKGIDRLAAVKAADNSKLTLALGKLMIKKVELETDLWLLEVNYKADHPDVKRSKRRVEIYEAAIKEILG